MWWPPLSAACLSRDAVRAVTAALPRFVCTSASTAAAFAEPGLEADGKEKGVDRLEGGEGHGVHHALIPVI